MEPTWLTPTLASFDERVRVERGPQIVEMPCTDANLDDQVTHAHYKKGRRDASGRLIRPAERMNELDRQMREADGDRRRQLQKEIRALQAAMNIDRAIGRKPVETNEPMKCVDWRGKHKAYVWKVYHAEVFLEVDMNTGEERSVRRFILVDEVEGRDEALARAKALLKGKA